MPSATLELTIVLILLVANGLFAMTEIAIVSSRKALLQSMAEQGSKGAARALALSACPNRFLSTVQIGITLVGIVAGALGSGTAATRLAEWIAWIPGAGAYAKPLSLAVVIGLLTFVSLVVGELVPKRLAMRFPETIACRMAVPMAALSTLAAPAVSLLSWSTGVLLRLLGVRDEAEAGMSREELTVLVRQGLTTGTIHPDESRMMEGVIAFEKLVAYDVMIPPSRMVWIDQEMDHEALWPTLLHSAQEVFPVHQGGRDNLVGVVSIRDLYGGLASGGPLDIAGIMQPPLLIPETQKARLLLETFRSTGQRAAFVLDEFGSVVGMVTLIDLVETIIGDVPSREEQLRRPVTRRADGSWLIDGLFEIEKLPAHLDDFILPEGGGDAFQTLSGWFIRELGRVPDEGDRIRSGDWTFEVIDMDHTRVDKVLATHLPQGS